MSRSAVSIMNDRYTKETRLLNYKEASIQSLITKRKWRELDDPQKVTAIYTYVRDEIRFGYNESDALTASEVLRDGYGQCNTKATLMMALLRAVGIAARLHGFTIDKGLQKGAVTGIWYKLAPHSILHSWVEVYVSGRWYILEGVILDKPYLEALQRKFKNEGASFCGYGAYTADFLNPKVDFDLNDTFIQEKGINQDFGLFDSPDDFYAQHQQNLSWVKRYIYSRFVRFKMNNNVDRIRSRFGT